MQLSLAAVRGNCHFLEQGLDLLRRVSPEVYRNPVRPGWAPVGSQFRHVLDHYRAFADGWASGRVDYDARQRNPAVEVDPAVAIAQAAEMIEALERIHVEDANRPLAVQMDPGGDQRLPDWRPSTIGRELQFLVSHTVHHYALIKLLLEDAGVSVAPDFGTAPSTLAHQAREQAEHPAVMS
ncbi:MAG TPA: DinB family protein [Gemmatimonadales bacterium]|nr:DinB family protein [Gemmatimonadales bacterium]